MTITKNLIKSGDNMKEFFKKINKKKYSKIIYIILGILVFILFLVVVITISKNKEKKLYEQLDKQNQNIVVSKEQKEKPGTFIRNLDTLVKEHCKNDICVKNVVIYYIKKDGRIEYEITNKSKKKVTGGFKLKFDNGSTVYIFFNKLKKNETSKGVISFTNADYSNVYDYKLVELKKDEIKKILNNKK